MSFGRPPVFKEGRVKNYTREQWEAALRKATGVVDRHKGERVERDKKTDCAHQTRRDSPRIQELKDQPNKHRLPPGVFICRMMSRWMRLQSPLAQRAVAIAP